MHTNFFNKINNKFPVSSDSSKDRIYEDLDAVTQSKSDEESRKNKMSTLEMFGKTGSVMRALWSEMPEVRLSILL